MSGWHDLARLGAVVRPVGDDWPHPPNLNRQRARFDSPLSATVALLVREIEMLDGSRIALGLGLRESQIRADGMPRSDARIDDPRVLVAFTSRWGPVVFATDEYRDWRDNLRAIALSMEALRKVDRYGVSKRGEQYRGWKALPTGTDPADAIATREQAEALLASYDPNPTRSSFPADPAILVRMAVKATHPDTGGDPVEFRKVMRAKEILQL